VSLHIDGGLLTRYLDDLYAIGAEPGGGAFRPLYSPAWAEACERVSGWIKDAGLALRRDAVGNLWGRLDGSGGGKAIVTGSHIDTVRRGGRLDGALGVCSGIVALRALKEQMGKPKKPLEVLVICEEEGSRFAANFWGSHAVVGDTTPEETRTIKDGDGVVIADAMRERGLDPAKVRSAARDDLEAWVELHIEQGQILESSGVSIGIVTALAGAYHFGFTLRGRRNHAGTTPMDLRRDALAGAAAMIQGIEATAAAMGRPAVATVGQVAVDEPQINVVPGEARFTVDLRHPDPTGLQALAQRIDSLCRTTASERKLEIEKEVLHERPPVPMDAGLQALIGEAARAEGVEPMKLSTGAGHDAQILCKRMKVGMLFVPSIGGVSHCPEENTRPEHLVLGTQALARTLAALAY
jgi:allantoate deiminase